MEEDLRYIASNDSRGNPLEGSRNYQLHLPRDIPAANFWSLIVYDKLTQLIIKTDQLWPSLHSNCKKLSFNQDGSVDAWFGPKAPEGKESNWVQTIPGKAWYMVFRLYDLLEPLPDNTWKPGEIEEVK